MPQSYSHWSVRCFKHALEKFFLNILWSKDNEAQEFMTKKPIFLAHPRKIGFRWLYFWLWIAFCKLFDLCAFLFQGRVNIDSKSSADIGVPQYFGERFCIKSNFNTSCRKGVSQSMKGICIEPYFFHPWFIAHIISVWFDICFWPCEKITGWRRYMCF